MGQKPKEEDLPFIHEKVLEILKLIDELCRENNIGYFMQAGTLLGAVRNHKFIPWDDDGDIMMYREEYEKFKALIVPALEGTQFFLKLNDRVPRVAYIPNEDIRVDVFIIDYLPDNKFKQKYKLFMIKLLQGMGKEDVDLKQYSLKGKILVAATGTMGRLFSDKKKLEWYEKMSVYGNDGKCSKCFFSNDLYRFIHYKFDRDYYRELVDMQYENLILKAPKNWDSYLKINYGLDYMIPNTDKAYVSFSEEELEKYL